MRKLRHRLKGEQKHAKAPARRNKEKRLRPKQSGQHKLGDLEAPDLNA